MAALALLRLWQTWLDPLGAGSMGTPFHAEACFFLAANVCRALFFWGRRVSQQVTGKDATVAKKAGPEEGWNEGL